MAYYSGRKVKVGVGKETTRGTAVAATYWLRWETFDFFDSATTTYNQSAIGVLDKYSQAEITQTWAEGALAGKVTDLGIGLLLWAALGSHSQTTHAGETVVYDHTFSESQANQTQTLTIVRNDPNGTTIYPMAVVKQMEIDAKAGDFVRHNTQFMAQPGTSSSSTPAYAAENEFKAKNVTVKMATSVGGLTGATAIPVNNVKLTIAKDASQYWIIGQNNPQDIFAHTTTITGSFQLLYTDNTYFTPRFANTIEAISITIANTDVVIGSTSNPSLSFTMPQCYLNTFKVDTTIDGMVQQTIDFTATYSIAAGYAITALLTNTAATY